MIRRTVSTVTLWGALGAILYFFGAAAGIWLVAALAVASQYEFYRLAGTADRPVRCAGLIAGALLLVAPFYAALGDWDPVTTGLSLFALGLIGLALVALASPLESRIDSLSSGVLGFALVAFPLHFFSQILLLVEGGAQGLILALWVVVTVKFTDIGAYLAGSFLGRHKMAPSLSPGKTWEGVAGGLLASVLMAAVFAAVFRQALPEAMHPLAAAGLALPIAAASIPSDLLESLFKRAAGAKDSGRTIPGIGGAYDLSDSLVLSAPMAFILLKLFITG